LQFFIRSFFDIIYGDQEFDRAELVIIIACISFSTDYCSRMFADLDGFFACGQSEGLISCEKLGEKVQEFTKIFGETSLHSDEACKNFIKIFCEEEGKIMDRFIKEDNIFDEENPDDCLLGRVNHLLEYFNNNLRAKSDQDMRKYMKIIQVRINKR